MSVQVTWAVPIEVQRALDRLVATGFYGASQSEVAVNLLSREFERIASGGILPKLDQLRESADRPSA